MKTDFSNLVIGVLGGAGPLASAQFINTIYKMTLKQSVCEQQLPIILLYSNPRMQDRTRSFLSGEEEELLIFLESALHKLINMGAEKLIMCCHTMHHLLPKIAQNLREKIISLPEALLNDVINYGKSVLLLSTKGSRLLRVFEKQANWKVAKKYVVELDDVDQDMVHKEIYKIKGRGLCVSSYIMIDKLLEKYNVKAWAAGCTEFHLFSAANNHIKETSNMPIIIDPLVSITTTLVHK